MALGFYEGKRIKYGVCRRQRGSRSMGKHLKMLIGFNIVLIMSNIVLLSIVYFDRNVIASGSGDSAQSAGLHVSDSLLAEPKNIEKKPSEDDIIRFDSRLLTGNETATITSTQSSMLDASEFELSPSNEKFETRILPPEDVTEKSRLDPELDAKYRAAAEAYTKSLETAFQQAKASEITTPSQ